MKTALVVLAGAVLAAAQDLNNLPPCGVSRVSSSVGALLALHMGMEALRLLRRHVHG